MTAEPDAETAPPPSPLTDADVLAAYSRWAPVYDYVFALPFLTGGEFGITTCDDSREQ